MTAPLFPPIESHRPVKLTAAIEKLKHHEGHSSPEMKAAIIKRLLDKIHSGQALSETELTFGVLHLEEFPDKSAELMWAHFEQVAKLPLLKAIAAILNREHLPLTTTRMFLESQPLSEFTQRELCVGLRKLGAVQSQANFTERLESLLRSTNDLINALGEFSTPDTKQLTNGQKRILHVWTTSEACDRMLTAAYDRFWLWLKEAFNSQDQALGAADRIIERYLSKTPSWSSQVLTSTSIAGRLVKDLIDQGVAQRGNRQYPAITRLLKTYFELLDVLKSLSQSVPERGQFWHHYLQYSSRIECKQYRTGQTRVAVAIQLGPIVIVECGPVGNAALVYDAQVFYGSIYSRKDWRDADLALKTSTYKDGRILHYDGWIPKLQHFLSQYIGKK